MSTKALMDSEPMVWEFAPRSSVKQVEEGHELTPKFDENGVTPCVTRRAKTGEVLMFSSRPDCAAAKWLGLPDSAW